MHQYMIKYNQKSVEDAISHLKTGSVLAFLLSLTSCIVSHAVLNFVLFCIMLFSFNGA